jgi:site-specific recombinase XerD
MGVDARTVMALMGWSSMALLQRYQHVVDELRRDAAERMGRTLWES